MCIRDREKSGEDFWVKAEKLYYTALIGYIFYEAPREEKNFATLLDMIDASEVREDNETYMNPIDRLFEALEKKEPTHFAVKQYKKYKLAAGVVSLKRLLNHSILENWSSKLIKKSLETYFFISRTKLYFLKNNMKTCQHLISSVRRKCKEL